MISVIICCYNSEQRLPQTLKHLALQHLDEQTKWEVVIVDNNCSDNTAKVAKQLWVEYGQPVPLKIVKENQAGLSYAKQRGLKEAKYDIVIFCDDDNWLASDFIQRSQAHMLANPNIGVMGGQSIGEFESDPKDWFFKYQNNFAIGKLSDSITDFTNTRAFVWGAGMVLRKKAVDELHDAGFNSFTTGRKGKQLTAGEDTELCYALKLAGWCIAYNPGLKFSHYMTSSRLSWNYLRKLHRGFGACSPMKDAYQKAFQYHINKNPSLQPWYKEVVRLLLILNNYKRKLIQMQFYPFEGDDQVLMLERIVGRIRELLRLRNRYDEQIEYVKNASWNRFRHQCK